MAHSINVPQSEAESETLKKSDGFFRSFVSHPASVGESYLGHFFFALKFSARLLAAGCAALVHAFIPAWFETTASDQVRKIHDELLNRHAKPGCD